MSVDADGRQEVFADRTSTTSQHAWQTAPNVVFSAWTPL